MIGLRRFFLILSLMAVLRVATGLIGVPQEWLLPLSLLLTGIFVAAPILALFFGADANWTPARAGAGIGLGVAAQIVFTLLATTTRGPASLIFNAIAQAALVTWCLGLGALLGSALREKNLLIPVSIFGAAYDIFLVLTPAGITNNILKEAPAVFTSIAAQVPAVAQHPTAAHAVVKTFIGPADLVFVAALFVVVFRFKMNPKLTLSLLAPVLVLYMLIVILTDISLPALLPIGACVLAANWKYFNLSREEWLATGGVAVCMGALIAWSLFRGSAQKEPQAEPSPTEDVQAPEGSARKPAPASRNPLPSKPPTAPRNTPDRR